MTPCADERYEFDASILPRPSMEELPRPRCSPKSGSLFAKKNRVTRLPRSSQPLPSVADADPGYGQGLAMAGSCDFADGNSEMTRQCPANSGKTIREPRTLSDPCGKFMNCPSR